MRGRCGAEGGGCSEEGGGLMGCGGGGRDYQDEVLALGGRSGHGRAWLGSQMCLPSPSLSLPACVPSGQFAVHPAASSLLAESCHCYPPLPPSLLLSLPLSRVSPHTHKGLLIEPSLEAIRKADCASSAPAVWESTRCVAGGRA